MKTLVAILLVLVSTTFSFAEDVIVIPNMTKPQKNKVDNYIITNDNGDTKAVSVLGFGKNSFVIVDEDGNSTYVTKLDD